MARKPGERTPYDERRLKNKPAVRIHLSVETHPGMEAIYADNDLFATWCRILVRAQRAHAGKTGNKLTVSRAALLELSGKLTPSSARALVERVASLRRWRVEYTPTSATITIRNFAKKQGFDPTARGVAGGENPTTPDPSESESESESFKMAPPTPSRPGIAEPEEPGERPPSGNGSGAHADDPEELVPVVLQLWRASDLPEPSLTPELVTALAEACDRHRRLADWEYLVADRIQGQRNGKTGEPIRLEWLVAADIEAPTKRAEYADDRWWQCWRRARGPE